MRYTSTHMERTPVKYLADRSIKKHLHARGEDEENSSAWARNKETPPRTWRGRDKVTFIKRGFRNTSTHVERTVLFLRGNKTRRETPPRTWRGPAKKEEGGIGVETPPRTWRGLREVVSFDLAIGNTSTHVERTSWHQQVYKV